MLGMEPFEVTELSCCGHIFRPTLPWLCCLKDIKYLHMIDIVLDVCQQRAKAIHLAMANKPDVDEKGQ